MVIDMSGGKEVLVIGGGASGLMAACAAAEKGASVLLIERNPFCGKKLNITGKGRGNLTNACELDEFLSNVPVNGRFLYRALTDFSPEDAVRFFNSRGVPTKTERGNRVFPVSDRARDLTDCLVRTAKSLGVSIREDTCVRLTVSDGKIIGALLQGDLAYGGVLQQMIARKIDVRKVKKPLFDIDYSDFFHIRDNTYEFYYD